MLLYCLKCRKNTESKNPKVVSTKKRRKVQCVIVKNRNLSKRKKLADY